MPADLEQWWTVRDVAARLRLHPDTVRRWITKGAVRADHVGAGPKPRLRISDTEARKLTRAAIRCDPTE